MPDKLLAATTSCGSGAGASCSNGVALAGRSLGASGRLWGRCVYTVESLETYEANAVDSAFSEMRYEWWRDENSVVRKVVKYLTAPVAEARWHTDQIPFTRSVEDAWDHGLTLLAGNFGIGRGDLNDIWLDQLTQLNIFVQHLHTGDSPQPQTERIKTAVAWYMGIRRKDPYWRETIYPQLKAYINSCPTWPYGDVPGVGKDLPCYVMIFAPLRLLDQWQGDGWSLIGHSDGDFPWQGQSPASNGVLHGHHLALDLVDMETNHLALGGVKVGFWAQAWNVVGSDEGAFPWQHAVYDDPRVGGPLTLMDNAWTYVRQPSGCLLVNENTNFPNLFKYVHSNDSFDQYTGQRVFKYDSGFWNGGKLWP